MANIFYSKRQRFYERCGKTLHELNSLGKIAMTEIPDDVIEHLVQCGAFFEDSYLYACVKSRKAENAHHFEDLLHQAKYDKWKIIGVKTSLFISILALIVATLPWLCPMK